MGAPNPEETGSIKRSDAVQGDRRRRLPWPKNRDFRILALDGGGIRGAFQGAFLAALEEKYLTMRSVAGYFDLVVGTSTGGLITCAFSVGYTAAAISELYTLRGRLIFPRNKYRPLRWLFPARNSRHHLQLLIEEVTGGKRIFESNLRFCIPSCEAKNREIFVWKTPHHPDYVLDWKDPIHAAASATTAAPTFFREFPFGQFEHLDGGLFANNPALVGVVEALSAFEVSPDRIKVLSIGCGNFGGPSLTRFKKRFGGILAWRDIHRWFLHFHSVHICGLVGLLIGPENQIRVDPKLSTPEIGLDDYDRTMSELVPRVAEMLEEHGEAIAKSFLCEPACPYSPYYSNSTPPP